MVFKLDAVSFPKGQRANVRHHILGPLGPDQLDRQTRRRQRPCRPGIAGVEQVKLPCGRIEQAEPIETGSAGSRTHGTGSVEAGVQIADEALQSFV